MYLPLNLPYLGISQKIVDPSRREQLRELLSGFQKDDGIQGGLILRTNGESASMEELNADMYRLKQQWAGILSQKQQKTSPGLLHRDIPLHTRILRDAVSERTEAIYVQSPVHHDALKDFCAANMPNFMDKIILKEDDPPSALKYLKVHHALNQCARRKVTLDGGAYLIIDQSEALTSIDVNTGGFIGKTNLPETILETNLKASKEIARQIRLRNLGGIIIVDFIDMHEAAHRQEVRHTFEQRLSLEKTKVTLGDFSSLGLVELTRKRTRGSILSCLCQPCPHCQGMGWEPSTKHLSHRILHQLRTRYLEEIQHKPVASYKAMVPPDLLEHLETYVHHYVPPDKVFFQVSESLPTRSFEIIPC